MERNIGGYVGTQEKGDRIDDGAEDAGDAWGFWERFKGTRRRWVEEEDIWEGERRRSAAGSDSICRRPAVCRPPASLNNWVTLSPDCPRGWGPPESSLSSRLLHTTCLLAARVQSSLLSSLKPEIQNMSFTGLSGLGEVRGHMQSSWSSVRLLFSGTSSV